MQFEKNRRRRRETVEIRIRSDEEPCLSMRIAREDVNEEKEEEGGSGQKAKEGQEGVN